MENWTKKTDEEVWGQAGEQPGSQASYWREIEQKRRLMLLQKASLEIQEKLAQQQLEIQQQQLEIQRQELQFTKVMMAMQEHAITHAADMARSTRRLVLFSAAAVGVSLAVFVYTLLFGPQ